MSSITNFYMFHDISFWSPLWKSIRTTGGWVFKPRLYIDKSDLTTWYLEEVVHKAIINFYNSGGTLPYKGNIDKTLIIDITHNFVKSFFLSNKEKWGKSSLNDCIKTLIELIDDLCIYDEFLFAYRYAACVFNQWIDLEVVKFVDNTYKIFTDKLQNFFINHIRVLPNKTFASRLLIFLNAFNCSRNGISCDVINIEVVTAEILNRIEPYFYYDHHKIIINGFKLSMNLSAVDELAKKISISFKKPFFFSVKKLVGFIECSEFEKKELSTIAACDIIRNKGVANYLSPGEVTLFVNKFIQTRFYSAIQKRLSALSINFCNKSIKKLSYRLVNKIDVSSNVLEVLKDIDFIIRKPIIALLSDRLNNKIRFLMQDKTIFLSKMFYIKKVFSNYFALIKKFAQEHLAYGQKIYNIENSVLHVIYIYKNIKYDDPQNMNTSLMFLNCERKTSSELGMYKKDFLPTILENLPKIVSDSIISSHYEGVYNQKILLKKYFAVKEMISTLSEGVNDRDYIDNIKNSHVILKVIIKLFKNKEFTSILYDCYNSSTGDIGFVSNKLSTMILSSINSINNNIILSNKKQVLSVIQNSIHKEAFVMGYLQNNGGKKHL